MRISKKNVMRAVVAILMLVMASMTVFAADAEAAKSAMYGTFWSLVPAQCVACKIVLPD